jgi:hypothetical protein
MNSLLDLFLFISRDLEAEYSKTRNKYRLVFGSLTVGLDVTIDKMDILEVLEVEKKWDSAVSEHLIYSMDYEEPHIFEARERERMKTAPDGDWCYKAHLTMENRDRYLSNEMYVDNMHMLSSPMCEFSYESTRLSRGLQSLAHLKMPPHTHDDRDDNEAFPTLYAEMLKKGEWLLASQFGADSFKWRAALRKGKADIAMPFKKSFESVYPVWVVGRYLFALCRVYARPATN